MITVWHHFASLLMTIGIPQDGLFNSTLKLIVGSYNLEKESSRNRENLHNLKTVDMVSTNLFMNAH